MIRAAILILTFTLLGCADLPQNQEQTRAWAHTSSMVTRKEYTVAGLSLESAESVLRKFSDKCLNKKVTHVSKGGEWATTSSYSSTFLPKIVREKNRTTLFLQRYAPGANMLGTPKDGRYDFITEVTPDPIGVAVFSARLKVVSNGEMSLGNILEDLESWLRGRGGNQFCPEVN